MELLVSSNSKKNNQTTILKIAESALRHNSIIEWAIREPFFYYLANKLCNLQQFQALTKHLPDRNYIFIVTNDETNELIH